MANPLAAIGDALRGRPSSVSIAEAVMHDDPASVEKFMSQGADLNATDEDGWTLVHAACWHDKPKALGELLKLKPNLDATDKAGRSAVHLAAFNGSDRCLRKVLHAGADANQRDAYNLTALHKASVAGQLASMRTLLEFRADVTCKTDDGLTATHLAAWKGEREAIRLLASHKADLDAASQDGSTVLHEAVRSGDGSTVSLLLQLGAKPGIPDKFGRRAQDLAFAAGDKPAFLALHTANNKVNPPTPADESVPEPDEFWSFLEKTGPATVPSAPPPDTTPLGRQGAVPTAAPHPRKEFEKWLGGLLFPQRAASGRPQAQVQGSAPYARMDTAPPTMPPTRAQGKAGQHTSGSAGGSLFAQRRQAAAAASAPTTLQTATPTAGGVETNVQLSLDPYEDAAPPQGADASVAVSTGASTQQEQSNVGNPLAGLMQQIGDKARQDLKTTTDNMARMFGQQETVPPAQAGTSKPPGAKKATMGDDDFYDSDDYDMPTVAKATKAQEADDEGWGERAAEHDDWGTTGAKAFAAKKKAARIADRDGRLMSVEEARAALAQMDVTTARAQGWLRGAGAARRLDAMATLTAAFPKEQESRVEARNPLQFLSDSVWQRRPVHQEEEVLAVQQHLQTSVTAAAHMAAASAPKAPILPAVDFYEIWAATDGFSASSLLLEDSLGKVFSANVLGAIHAVRVLNSSLFAPDALAAFLSEATTLHHPHIVTLKGAAQARGLLVYDLPECGNVLYLIQTGTLPTGEPLQWNKCVDIALAVASAVQYLHNRSVSVPHGRLSTATALVDRNCMVKVSDVGLGALCSQESWDTNTLLLQDIHSLGEILMQLLTLNTQPIDEAMRKSILEFSASGNHIGPSQALGWPASYAQAFETIAVECLKATRSSNTAGLLCDSIVPGLLALRGDTLAELIKSAPSAPPEVEAPRPPSAFLCPLTQEVMLDPVLVADGFVYERSAIEQWLSMGRRSSPMTNEPLAHTYLTAQGALRGSIEGWLRSQNGVSTSAVLA